MRSGHPRRTRKRSAPPPALSGQLGELPALRIVVAVAHVHLAAGVAHPVHQPAPPVLNSSRVCERVAHVGALARPGYPEAAGLAQARAVCLRAEAAAAAHASSARRELPAPVLVRNDAHLVLRDHQRLALLYEAPESRFAERPAARLPNLVSAVLEPCDKCLESR
jgi:hypothetical protein